MKKTKILATLGPSSASVGVVRKMLKAGMDAVRINTSHGDIEQYKELISNVRRVGDLPIMLDTQGPEIRLFMKGGGMVQSGQEMAIGFGKTHALRFNHDILGALKTGGRILAGDGALSLRVKKKSRGAVVVVAENDGMLRNRMGINVPDAELNLPVLTKHDKKVISLGLEAGVDFIAASFTQNAKDIRGIRRRLKGETLDIIAKIENTAGVEKVDEILKESDGLMVARGDLGVEIPYERIPLIQKEFVKKCNEQGKPVIIATEMLASMVRNPRPTRAETSDVANAILDGADCLMLSNETATGRYPVEAVRTMASVSRATENHIGTHIPSRALGGIPDTVTKSIFNITRHLPVTNIVAITRSGFTARMISRFRLRKPIIALTNDARVRRRLELVFGVRPVLYKRMPKTNKVLKSARFCLSRRLLSSKDMVVFTAGVNTKAEHISNLIEIHTISDLLGRNPKKP